MNKKLLRQQEGQSIRIRPWAAFRGLDCRNSAGPGLHWTVQSVTDEGVSLECDDPRVDIFLPHDKVKNFENPDCLHLRCQVTVSPNHVAMEVLPDPNNQRRQFAIAQPDACLCAFEEVPLQGSGAPEGSAVLVFHRLVDGKKLYLQGEAVEGNPAGFWAHPGVQLSSAKERYIYALAVPNPVLEEATSLFDRPLRTIRELRDALKDAGIDSYELSQPRHLDSEFFDDIERYMWLS